MRISQEDSDERGEKEYEGRREWVTGGRARMASSETGFATSYLKEPVCVFVLYLSMSFNIRFRFLLVSP